MKHYVVACLLLISIAVNFAYAQTAQYTSATGWAGHYIYEENPIKANAGYAEVMTWDVTITQKNNLTGIIEINGQQTFFKLLTNVIINGNSITFTYNKTLDGNDFGAYKKGQVLFVLKKTAGKLITQWAVLTPRLAEKYPKECACFVKNNDEARY